METQVRTPHAIFHMPQRLVVPLFQRPYVWNEENQWAPLWEDIRRVAERLLKHPETRPQPHFLGAVVLQQLPMPIGLMAARTIIDGQQRLTTLQLLLDALHAELLAVSEDLPAKRIEDLVTNPSAYCKASEDRFKVWPTNRDRPAFNSVMGAAPPVDYEKLAHRGEKIVDAHEFFAEQAREWLSGAGGDQVPQRAAAIETVVRELIQMVVIELTAAENAQEIFETLNARGTPLTAADLIKNFVFQRLSEADADVQAAYIAYWKGFETGFWETEVNVGRMRYPRSAIFLNHWLIARTGKEVVAREVFIKFKGFANYDASLPIMEVLQQLHDASGVYNKFITAAEALAGPIDQLGLFGYRTGVLESEVIKPLVLWLLDPQQPPLSDAQRRKALDVVESWMVRRMLVRATTKDYNHFVAELISKLRAGNRDNAGDYIETFLRDQTSDSRYWPDDSEVREELGALQTYRRLRRGRLRMVLETIEDHMRGWRDGEAGLGDERVARGKLHIEHIMPRKWQSHWPLLSEGMTEADRDRNVDTLGNLTLLTKKLNSKVSNGPWLGIDGKRQGLEEHDVLFLNRELLKTAIDKWTDEDIHARTKALIEVILQIWPAPAGHRSGFSGKAKPKPRKKVHLPDLINAGVLQPGITLIPRRKRFRDRVATLLPDGRLEVDGVAYSGPTDAASAIVGKRTGGWAFFFADEATKRTLRNVRSDYIDEMSVDAEDENGEDDDEDES